MALRSLIINITADSSSYEREIRKAQRLGTEYYKSIENGGRGAIAAQKQMERALSSVTAKLGEAKRAAIGLAGPFATMFASHQLVTYADSWNQVSGRLKLASSSAGDYLTVQKELMDISQRTSTSFEANANLYSRVAQSMREAGHSSAEIAAVTETVATSLKLSGAGAAESSSVITQLSQALGSGVLRGQEFNSVMENGGRLAKLLADGMGTTVGGLRKMAAAGELTTDKLIPILTQTELLREEFEQLPDTISGGITRVQNAFMAWVGGADQATGASAALASALTTVSNNMGSVATLAGAVITVGIGRQFNAAAKGVKDFGQQVAGAYKQQVANAAAQVRAIQVSKAAAQADVYHQLKIISKNKDVSRAIILEKELTQYRTKLTAATNAQAAAQARLNHVTSALAGAKAAVGGLLGLIGGIPGLLMLGVGGWYAFSQQQKIARQEAEEYISRLDEIIAKLPKARLTEVSADKDGLTKSLESQINKVAQLRDDIKGLQSQIATNEEFKIQARPQAAEGYDRQIANLQTRLATLKDSLVVESAEQKRLEEAIEQVQKRQVDLIRQQTAAQAKSSLEMAGFKGLVEQINGLLGVQNALLDARPTQTPTIFPFTTGTTFAADEKQTQFVENLEFEKRLNSEVNERKRERLRLDREIRAQMKTDSPEDGGAAKSFYDRAMSAGMAAFDSKASNKTAAKGMKDTNSEAKKLGDTYASLVAQQEKEIALAGDSSSLAALKYDLTKGELAALSDVQKQTLLRNEALKEQKQLVADLADYERQLAAELKNTQATRDLDITGYGMGEKLRGREQERIGIDQKYDRNADDLLAQRDAGDISEEAYRARLALSEKYRQQDLTSLSAYYVQKDALETNWQAGLTEGLTNWATEASNYAQQAADAAQEAMGGMVSTISDALIGNEADWRDWAKSVLKSISNVLINASLVNGMNALGGAIGGSAGGFLQSMFKVNALGDTYSNSPSLSAYSGQVVSQPTFFAFAQGAGVMGEAGPEGIFPLTRGRDGKLGVKAVGAGGGGDSPISISSTVNVYSDGGKTNTDAKATAGANSDAVGRAFEQTVTKSVVDGIRRELRPGGLIWSAQNAR